MTDPTWQTADGSVKLFLGDCLDVLPTLEGVDAVVCDPPFGIGFKYESHDDNVESYGQLMQQIVGHVERIRGDGPAVFWQGMLNCARWHQWFPSEFRLFAACKGFVQYRPTSVQFGWDPVVWWGTPKGSPSVFRRDWHLQSLAPFGAGRERIDHPCPRPLEQVEYVVDLFTVGDDVTLDPFMGSGTTGVACVRTGRKFIGIEKEPKYFDIAVKRIEAELSRMPLFEDAPAVVQKELL
jgi:DNA modification methylase